MNRNRKAESQKHVFVNTKNRNKTMENDRINCMRHTQKPKNKHNKTGVKKQTDKNKMMHNTISFQFQKQKENNPLSKHTNKHFASTTQLIYTPFMTKKHAYNPPHLNSTQVEQQVFQSECRNWTILSPRYRKLNYDDLYAIHEKSYQKLPKMYWNSPSKILALLEQDRARYYYSNKIKRFKKISQSSSGLKGFSEDEDCQIDHPMHI